LRTRAYRFGSHASSVSAVADANRSYLRVVHGATGEVAEDLTPIPTDVACLVDELVDLRRKLAAVRAQLTKLRTVDPDAETIMGLMEYWRERCRHPRARLPVDGARWEKTKARLADFEVGELREAIDACAAYPFMGRFGVRYCEPGPDRKRRDELTLIFRDERHVEELVGLGRERAREDCHRAYGRWLHGQCRARPGLVRALALLAEREPHGEVLARAAIWAKANGPVLQPAREAVLRRRVP
jgi:hypothetical protein